MGMNNLDKFLTTLSGIKRGQPNRYEDKDDWGWFDYLMGYGFPIIIFSLVISLFVSSCNG